MKALFLTLFMGVISLSSHAAQNDKSAAPEKEKISYCSCGCGCEDPCQCGCKEGKPCHCKH